MSVSCPAFHFLPISVISQLLSWFAAPAFAWLSACVVSIALYRVAICDEFDGHVIVDDSDPEKRATRVITPEQAHAVQEVMKGVVTSGTGTAASLYNGQPVAGKTGTSEDYKDISFVGITPFAAAAIWVGDPTNVSAVPTGTAADVFRSYAAAVMDREGIPVQDFAEAANPEYQTYNDSHYHISSGYSYYYDNSYKTDDASSATSATSGRQTPQPSASEAQGEQQADPSETKRDTSGTGGGSKKKQT